MAKIVWGATGSRIYENGVDRGVLYLNGYAGLPWNGLVSVNETLSGGEPLPYYLDGFKYQNLSSAEEYASTISAFSAPQEFARCEGVSSLSNGLFASQQKKVPFGFTYRTLIGNDEDSDFGYRLHIVYNLLVSSGSKSYKTRNNSDSAEALSWDVTSTPKKIPGIRPTAHLMIDSRQTTSTRLAIVEGYLYGGEGIDPFLPTPAQLAVIFAS